MDTKTLDGNANTCYNKDNMLKILELLSSIYHEELYACVGATMSRVRATNMAVYAYILVVIKDLVKNEKYIDIPRIMVDYKINTDMIMICFPIHKYVSDPKLYRDTRNYKVVLYHKEFFQLLKQCIDHHIKK